MAQWLRGWLELINLSMIFGGTLWMWPAGWTALECWTKYRSDKSHNEIFGTSAVFYLFYLFLSFHLFSLANWMRWAFYPTLGFSQIFSKTLIDVEFGWYFFCSQVTEETAQMVESVGYSVTLRGKVNVKGKGELTTYFVNTEHSSPSFWPERSTFAQT